jgi:transposase
LQSELAGDRRTSRRVQAVLGYIVGRRVTELANDLGTVRGTVNHWVRQYQLKGIEGLRRQRSPGAQPKLSAEQRKEVARLIEAGPPALNNAPAGWTGRVVADLIWQRFGVRYHPRHVPRLLHQLGVAFGRVKPRLVNPELKVARTVC